MLEITLKDSDVKTKKKASVGVPKILLSEPNTVNPLANKLILMNDDEKRSFVEIADCIEKNL